MPDHILFVRFFLDYSKSFPFEQFDQIADAAIANAVEALCKEWWSDPKNKKLLQASRKETAKRLKEWNEGALAWPGRNLDVPGNEASSADDPRVNLREVPSFEVPTAFFRCFRGRAISAGISFDQREDCPCYETGTSTPYD